MNHTQAHKLAEVLMKLAKKYPKTFTNDTGEEEPVIGSGSLKTGTTYRKIMILLDYMSIVQAEKYAGFELDLYVWQTEEEFFSLEISKIRPEIVLKIRSKTV